MADLPLEAARQRAEDFLSLSPADRMKLSYDEIAAPARDVLALLAEVTAQREALAELERERGFEKVRAANAEKTLREAFISPSVCGPIRKRALAAEAEVVGLRERLQQLQDAE